MRRRLARAALALVLPLAVAGCGVKAQNTAAQDPAAAAWVELTGEGAEIRAITPAPRCPVAMIDGRRVPLALRAGPNAAFPNRICEAKLPAAARRVEVGGAALPIPVKSPKRIIIFGDTGCRISNTQIQNCNDPAAWPFARVAAEAAARHPDLVIHVGDYYYRERPCPSPSAGCEGSPHGDDWRAWDADFFAPAKPLFRAAPWVFVRGNHESCGRGAEGWFRMLDAAPAPQPCPAESAPFAVPIGGLNLYVLDSADADDRFPTRAEVEAFGRQLDAIEARFGGAPGWIVTHRPIWGLVPVARLGPFGPLQIALNLTEQAAARGRDLSEIAMVVSGHVHHFASYSFHGPRPAQLIAGTGGDIGEKADTRRPRADTVELDGMTADSLSFERFGYFELDRAGEDWFGTFHGVDGRVVARCRLHLRSLICVPARRPS